VLRAARVPPGLLHDSCFSDQHLEELLPVHFVVPNEDLTSSCGTQGSGTKEEPTPVNSDHTFSATSNL
jgi:hypothetical protein